MTRKVKKGSKRKRQKAGLNNINRNLAERQEQSLSDSNKYPQSCRFWK